MARDLSRRFSLSSRYRSAKASLDVMRLTAKTSSSCGLPGLQSLMYSCVGTFPAKRTRWASSMRLTAIFRTT